MKPQIYLKNSLRVFKLLAALGLVVLAAASSKAASGTWSNAPTDATWINALNWLGAVPGTINNTANNGTDSGSIAYFTNPITTYGGSAHPVTPDDATVVNGKARMLGQIIFDGPNCGAYVFYTSSPYAAQTATTPETGVLSLCVQAAVNQVSTNGMYMSAVVTQPQNFLCPVQIRLPSSDNGVYGFTNNSTTPTATLYFNNIFLYPGATSRGVTFDFAGSNTGTNTVGTLSQSVNQSSGTCGVKKEGTGRWIFAGANTFKVGSPMNIVGGTLEVQSSSAFGLSSSVLVTNATLQIDGVSLSANSIALNNGGTILVSGTATVNGIQIGNQPATSVTLATVNSSDTFTSDGYANLLYGGAADTVIHVAGPGTVSLPNDASITNSWSFDGGTTLVGSANALGYTPESLAFGAGSTGILEINGFNITALSLTSNPTLGSPVVENGGASPATLIVSNASANTFAGVLKDGTGGGTLAVTKAALGTVTLSGANTYTGNTTLSGGTVNLTGSLGNTAVTIGSSATLSGNGTVSGSVNNASGGSLTPGNGGVGTLSVGTLALNSGSLNNIQFNGTPANSLINVTTSGGLTLNGGSVNLYQAGGITPFASLGTYNLIQYAGSIAGTGVSSLSIGNPQAGYGYAFSASGGYVKVTITAVGVNTAWNVDANGNWSDGTKWNGGTAPHSAGDAAILGVGTALRTVTLDANESVGGVTFTNNNSFVVASAGHTLTLDNKGAGAPLTVSAGTANAIQTAVSFNDNVTATVTSGKSLAISGAITSTGTQTLNVDGAGTLALSGNNAYGPGAGSVGTTLSGGGILNVGNNNALGAGDLLVSISGTIQPGSTGLTLANNVDIAAGATVNVNNNGDTLTLNGSITPATSGDGGITVTNNGTLVLAGNNTYTGNTTVNGGVLNLASASALNGNGLIVLNGGDLLGSGSYTFYNNVGIGPVSGGTGATALIDVVGGQQLNLRGMLASTGNTGTNNLVVNSGPGHNGELILSGANTFAGTTTISNGVLDVQNTAALADSLLNYNNQGGILLFDGITTATLGGLTGTQNLALTNLVSAGVTLTVDVNGSSTVYSGDLTDVGLGGALTMGGAGTLTLAGTNTLAGAVSASAGGIVIATNGGLIVGSISASGSTVPQIQINGGSVVATNGTFSASGSAGPGNLVLTSGSADFSGTVNVNSGSSESSTSSGITVNSNSTFNASSLVMGRGAMTATTQPATGQAGQGLIVSGGTAVVTNNITMGPSGANSGTSLTVNSGSLNVGGSLTFGCNNGGRWSIVDVAGGTLTVTDVVTGILLGAPTTGAGDVFQVRGGTATVGIINLGNTNNTTGGAETNVVNLTGGSLYLGAGGIVQVLPTVTPVINFSGGVLGASASWTCTNGATVAGVTIQCADSNGVPHNITLTGPLGGSTLTNSGGGTLTLSGANFYTNTVLTGGTLNINGSYALGSANYGSLTFNGGTLQFAPAFSGNGPGDFSENTAATPVAVPVTFNGNATVDVNGNTVTCAYGIGNGGSGSLIVKSTTPGGVLDLQGTNSYAGSTIVTSGTLELGRASIYTNSTVSVAGGAKLQLDFAVTNVVTNLVFNGVSQSAGVYNNNNAPTYLTGTGSLALVVPSSVNTTPTNIVTMVSGNLLTLSWPADHIGWRLVAQTNSLNTGLNPATNAWFTVAGSASVDSIGITLNPGNPTVFYRMVYP